MNIWTFGDSIDTDLIMPAKYLNNNDPRFYSKHCLEDVNPDFARGAVNGDILIAGDFFGCGSSRESAPNAIKYLGIQAVFAKSFSRIFFRNAINIALPVVIVDENCYELLTGATQVFFTEDYSHFLVEQGDSVTHVKTGYAPFITKILKNNGLLNYYMENRND